MKSSDLPVACMLTAEALRARREGLLRDLVRRADTREELLDGLRLQFSAATETLSAIARAVEAERHCCRFLRFELTVDPDGGPFHLQLTGPTGTREFLAALLDV